MKKVRKTMSYPDKPQSISARSLEGTEIVVEEHSKPSHQVVVHCFVLCAKPCLQDPKWHWGKKM